MIDSELVNLRAYEYSAWYNYMLSLAIDTEIMQKQTKNFLTLYCVVSLTIYIALFNAII